ncbi:predicted protein [Postia placenta Mad-698-R]|uniref:Alpha-type protein kinase domain-containing protein n=1 Tax=Postia placenta MAD-698-R-SB12 TaxID=670580 RepID=A0A1X6N6Y9_9APHY|nr:hypothetical protein POSPLADRAFT_1045456 [Postia placenta MAD-698-R-SB12]EED85595.1 predicted protein [Postia placenta Mad-698-R]OSX64398.1 hypothetical protein POSPLADRAFT_1045456 [Postia placenta MAD-698-R-SB12]
MSAEIAEKLDGEVRLISDPRTETILVAKDWQQYIAGGLREGGYIGKGYSKFAFEGRLGTIPVAIFQMRPIGDPSDRDLNQRDMIAELRILALGQYFLDAFYRRVKAYHVKGLPGTFVGQVTSELPPPPASIADKDTRSLLYDMFLAAPLLETRDIEPGYKEVKYSGTDCAGQNTDTLGVAIDAFAHHTLVDSQGTLVFVDLQGLIKLSGKFVIYDPQIQSLEGSAGFYDKGKAGIDTFIKQHTCNGVCRALGLDKESKYPAAEGRGKTPVVGCSSVSVENIFLPRGQQGPLRHGFPSE